MRSSPSPGSDRDFNAVSGAAALRQSHPSFRGRRRDRPDTGQSPALACREACPQLKDSIADLFCSAKVNCGQRGARAQIFGCGGPDERFGRASPRSVPWRHAARRGPQAPAPGRSPRARARDRRRARPAPRATAAPRTTSRRSIGASVSVSKPIISRSPPGELLGLGHQHQVLDADAVGAFLVVAGLVGDDHAGLQHGHAALGDALRALVHGQVAADAVAGAVVEVERPPPTAPAARRDRARCRACPWGSARWRWRCGP